MLNTVNILGVKLHYNLWRVTKRRNFQLLKIIEEHLGAHSYISSFRII